MPETDISPHSQQLADTAAAHAPQAPAVADPVVPDTSFLVQETAAPYPTDTVAEWVPRRREPKIDTCFISAFDFPPTAMDTTYLDSCLREETITAPPQLLNPPHIAVSAEERAFDSLFAKLTNVADTTFYGDGRPYVSVKEAYRGFEGQELRATLEHQPWFTPFVFILFFCYGLVFAYRSKALGRDAKDFFSSRSGRATGGHPQEQKTQYRFAVNLLAVFSISLFVLQAHLQLAPHSQPRSFLATLACATGLTGLYAVFKLLSSAYMGYVFVGSEARHEWSRAFWYLFSTLGLALFPLALCATYGPAHLAAMLLKAGIAVAAVAEMMLVAFVVKRFFSGKFSILYLFLYLCTLEILPLAALLLGYRSAIATI